MKKLFALLVIASLGMFTIGCGEPAKKPDVKKSGDTVKPDDGKMEGTPTPEDGTTPKP